LSFPTSPTHTLSTPFTGAIYAMRVPSGEICGETFSGFPIRTSSGMMSTAMYPSLGRKTKAPILNRLRYPPRPFVHGDPDDRPPRSREGVLVVTDDEGINQLLELVALVDHAGRAGQAAPPQTRPVLLIVVDEQRDMVVAFDVGHAAKTSRALRLLVDGG